MKRFKGLTSKQMDVFARIAINDDLGHHRKTTEVLERKGLIVSRVEIDKRGFPPIQIKRYDVPISVHMEYCQWCSENVKEE